MAWLIWHVERLEEQKYNIKNWGHRPSQGDVRAKQVTLCFYNWLT